MNLAVAAVEHYNTILLNYDLACPELDGWFGIKHSSSIEDFNKKDAGIMTLGKSLTPELAGKMIRRMKWGVEYLPAGNKLTNIGTPDFGEPAETVELFRKIIQLVKEQDQSVIIVNAGRDFEYPPAYAAIAEADVLVIPYTGNPFEGELIAQQLKELVRIKVEKPTVELLLVTGDMDIPKQICQRRVEIKVDYTTYIKAAQEGEVYALSAGKREWERVLLEIL
ncbi:hypothetical protein JOC37_001336 [Desulfohalotomaculum tongense]|uniref:hypothetical protein n=1 Tax=Desulforadius tongensis TaxID=1216062 RepID=UPI0019570241|nr:hypothetical protein [Desulforadius tongensis]MBM7854956.1 hypothetical protein [Desulforadius tongensis]